METETTIDPLDINKHPKIIKEAQQELGNLDILVCGQCHMVFHFVEQFQDHRLLGNCSGLSSIRENNINESKAQVWAFLLWKGSQTLEENENSWVVYQKWCKMESHVKEAWVVAGRNVQVFTKLSAAKMQEVRAKTQVKPKLMDEDPLEEGEIRRTDVNINSVLSTDEEFPEDPLAESDEPSDLDSELDTEEEAEKEEIEKIKNSIKNNGTAEIVKEVEADKEDGEKKVNTTIAKPQGVPVTVDKNSRLAKRTDKVANTTKECIVEKILAKRFNPRRKLHEYLIKWEGFTHDQNTWEPPVHLSSCQHLVDAFERNLARQKEAKAAAQAALIKQQKAAAKQQAGPSGIIAATTAGGRPQRTSKQKALDQVKQWCGNISDRDDDLGLKRRADSDSDDDINEKKIKMELDSGSEDEWQADEAEIERHTTVGRPKILQKSTNVINGIARKQMTANEIARSIGLASPDRPNSPPVLVTNARGVVKVLKNQMPNLASGVYIMSKKDGIVKLESSPGLLAASGANIVRVQKSVGGGATTSIMRVMHKPAAAAAAASAVSQSQVRVVPKALADANSVRLSPGMSRPGLPPKIKTQIKPAMRLNTTTTVATLQPGQKLQAQRMQIGTPQLKVISKTVGRLKAPIPAQQTILDLPDELEKSESSEDDFDPFPKDLPPPEPDSPPREFTLDPITGLVLGHAEGEPEQQAQPSPAPAPDSPQEKVIIKQEVQTEDLTAGQGQDMPSLIMADGETLNVATTMSGETTTTITLPETGEPLMITGEDGVVYQVAGQNEEGQTLLVAQGVDGQQQCVYVTTTTEDGQGNVDGTVLTLDSAVAEAMGDAEGAVVAQTEMEPLTVQTNTMEEQEQGDGTDDGSSQVVAQLVKAELPSPGGTRKVVLLLPDGNLLMTEVDAEQYAALELDK